MSKKNNHWCIVCGKGYYACDSCGELKHSKFWNKFTDTSEHYKIHLILNDYANKVITKKEAKAMLNKCDINGWEEFNPNVVSIIKDLLALNNARTKKENTEEKKDSE